MLNIKSIVAGIASLRSEKSRLKNALETKLRRREDLHSMPLPKSDFINMVTEKLDSNQDPISAMLRQQLGSWIEQPLENPVYSAFLPLSWPNGSGITGEMLHYLLREDIKEAMAKAIDKWSWPVDCGPTRAERKLELVKLDKEIEELNAQLQELEEVLPAAGNA